MKLNGFSGRFTLRNVENMKLYDRVDGTLYAESDFVKTAPVAQTVDNNYATGGVGNSRIAVFKSNKNIDITIELGYFELSFLQGQAGELDVETSNVHLDERYTTTIVDTLTLSHDYVVGGDITVEEITSLEDRTAIRRFTKVSVAPAAADEYQIAGADITFFAGDVPIGTFIRVLYETVTTNDIDVISAKANVFSGVYKAVLEVEVQDVATDKKFIGQLVIPRASLDDSLDISFQNDGEVAIQNASLMALADINTKDLWNLKVYTADDL